MVKRKRGGQIGNVNALKHGFYSERFKDIEVSELGAALSNGLQDEIALLRVVMRRVFVYADEEVSNLDGWGNTLALLAKASMRLAGLLRTQKQLGGGEGDVIAAALTQALSEVTREMGLR